MYSVCFSHNKCLVPYATIAVNAKTKLLIVIELYIYIYIVPIKKFVIIKLYENE